MLLDCQGNHLGPGYVSAMYVAHVIDWLSTQRLTVINVFVAPHRYPLVLKRGRMRMAPAPDAIQKAETEIAADQGKTYRLVPSKTAVTDAASLRSELAEGDVPLFVADRLAFAGKRGPQLPLFLEKADCQTSYDRLRESSSRLPETPNIRTTTLMDVLNSMEKGTRPGVSQLEFYSSAEDLVEATDLMTQP
jgi:Tic22-like family